MSTAGADTATLDGVFERRAISRADLIKLDVDGGELDVLRGATAVLRRFSPRIVMELSPYVHEEHGLRPEPAGGSFDELVELLASHGYAFWDLRRRTPLPRTPAALRALVPDGASINVLLSRE